MLGIQVSFWELKKTFTKFFDGNVAGYSPSSFPPQLGNNQALNSGRALCEDDGGSYS